MEYRAKPSVGKALHPGSRRRGPSGLKQRIRSAVDQTAPVRNEIAHVREVEPNRLLKAKVACDDIIELVRPIADERR